MIFIGEDEVPLLKESWTDGEKKTKGRAKRPNTLLRKPGSPRRSKYFPQTFVNYLFSQNSVIIRLLTSLCPPFGKYKRIPVDAEGSFLSCFLLICTLYWGYVNSRGESRMNAFVLSSSLTIGYLLIISGATWLLSFCTKTIITMRYEKSNSNDDYES